MFAGSGYAGQSGNQKADAAELLVKIAQEASQGIDLMF